MYVAPKKNSLDIVLTFFAVVQILCDVKTPYEQCKCAISSFLRCFCVIIFTLPELITSLIRASQHSWAEHKHLNFTNNVNLWRIFDVLTCNCSSFIHLHSHTSGLWAPNNLACVFFLLTRLLWELCSCCSCLLNWTEWRECGGQGRCMLQ